MKNLLVKSTGLFFYAIIIHTYIHTYIHSMDTQIAKLISSVYPNNSERSCLKEDKEGEVTTYSGNEFQCNTVLGKEECK